MKTDADEIEDCHEDGMDAVVCPVHGENLLVGNVEIVYGLIREDDVERQASQLFPFARKYLFGGCCTGGDEPQFGQIKFCPMCREEKPKWMAKESALRWKKLVP